VKKMSNIKIDMNDVLDMKSFMKEFHGTFTDMIGQ
jgi:hypothetical protein